MPKKKSHHAKNERRDRSNESVDPVEFQFSIKTKTPVGVRVTKELLEQAVEYWSHHGRSPRGFDIKITRWRNPNRLHAADREWREPMDSEQENCALFRRMLRSGRVQITFS